MKTKIILSAMVGLVFLAGGILYAAVKINAAAPNFSLADLEGQSRSLAEFKGKFVVLEWVNYGCPFVKKHYDSGNMQQMQADVTSQGVVWLSICSSAKGKQGNMEPQEWKKAVKEKGAVPTTVLLDPDGTVGRLYGAKTTPHMFIINREGVLIYQGAIDNKPGTDPSEISGSINYVRRALQEATQGKKVSVATTESYGCSVKY